jgi:hypothetical protein
MVFFPSFINLFSSDFFNGTLVVRCILSILNRLVVLNVCFRALRILNAVFNFYKFLAVYILMTFYYFFYIFLYYMHK